MAVNRLDNDKLVAASEHVMYEFWMLYRLHDLILAKSSSDTHSQSQESAPQSPVAHSTDVAVHIIGPSGIRQGSPPESLVVMHNALIEAFALHARVVYDFFYALPQSRKPDDIAAEHYFADLDEWLNTRPAINKDKIEAVRNRVNKEIAHLTYKRQMITPDSKDWPIIEIMQDLDRAAAKFLDLVPDDLIHPKWRQRHTS